MDDGDRKRYRLEQEPRFKFKPPMVDSFLIVTPPNLQAQWTREIHRFVKHGVLDIFQYNGTFKSRRNYGFWRQGAEGWCCSLQPPWRLLLLATSNVRPTVISFLILTLS